MKKLKSIELFAGGGGLALGMEKAGFENVLLNEFDKNASNTLKFNRKKWNVINDDIKNISFIEYKNKIDLITGGFPCQAFSHSGKRLGFEDTRGTLFYEFARAIKEVEPICFLAENVKGLLTHDSGRTYETIVNTFKDLGYHVFDCLVLNANDYNVAQKRERVFIFGCKKELKNKFKFDAPKKYKKLILKDILVDNKIYKEYISNKLSNNPKYSKEKENLFKLIPEGGNWKNLPIDLQKKYLGKMFDSDGGKTGILKKLSYDSYSPTILTNPSQKQTERCHPKENRPLTIRESARIQSFPDDWEFVGSIASQYKQIGNAVPPNLAFNVGKMIYEQIINLS